MTQNAAYDDLIASISLLLHVDCTGRSLEDISAAMQARIQALEAETDGAVEFDEDGLELGMLKKMLAMLVGRDIDPNAPLIVQ